MNKRNIPPDLKLIDYLDLAFTFTPCSSDSNTRAARFSLSTPGQETNAPKTPEVHHFKTSHTLLDITSESPKYRGPNKKTVKLIKSRIGGMISQAADKFTDCDASTKLQLYKELLKDKLQLEEELKQVKQHLDIAKKFKINNEKDTEMIDPEVKSLNEIGVQTIESRIKEDSSPKTFEILMKNYSNKNSSDLLDLHHYFFHFAKRMMNIEKCFLDLSSRQTKLTRTNDGYNMLCHLAAPRMPMDSLEAIEHRKTLILQIASKFDLKLQPENCMTPLEASLMMNKCRLSMRCYLKLRDLVTNYITLPSRHTIDKQTKDIDEIFKTTVRYVPFENDRILVTTVDNVREVITYRVQTLINHGNFQRMPSPWEKTIFLAEYYDKGGEHISVKLGVGLACSLFNSDPQRVTLVGGYHGDMKYMPACFRPVIKQLNGIKFIEVIIDGKVERFEIVRRFSSDTEGILQCHCRLSATSNTYCWNCNYVRPADRRYSNPEAVKVGDRRLTFHECDGGYAGPPLFDSLPHEIALPVLHIFQGLLNDKLNHMEETLKELDFFDLSPEERTSVEDKLTEAEEQIRKLQAAYHKEIEKFDETESTVNFIDHLLENKAVHGHFAPNNAIEGGCDVPFCANRAGYDVEETYKMCTCCTPAKRYHKFCIGFHGNKARVECRPVRDYLRRNQLVIYLQNSLTKGQENLRKLLISVTKREKKLEKALISKANVQGQNMRQYYSILNQMGVARNAWFGNYNGNQARIVMTQTEKFEQLDAAHTCPRIHHLVTAIKKLGNLQHYTAAKFLTDEQIEDLKILIEDFVQHMVKNLDDTNVTPKAHYLLHIHENAEKYKTLGLISEQAIEALHAFVNSIYSRASFFKKEDRDEWVMKYIFRQNILKDMSKKE